MCCCGTPTRNGDFGARPVNPPTLADGDTLLFDEPGRCCPQVNGTGSTDYHSHHFRVVDGRGGYALLIRHGGGDERIGLGYKYTRMAELLTLVGASDARYLWLYALYRMHSETKRTAQDHTRQRYERAFVEGRLKKRKTRGSDRVRVWIEPAP